MRENRFSTRLETGAATYHRTKSAIRNIRTEDDPRMATTIGVVSFRILSVLQNVPDENAKPVEKKTYDFTTLADRRCEANRYFKKVNVKSLEKRAR